MTRLIDLRTKGFTQDYIAKSLGKTVSSVSWKVKDLIGRGVLERLPDWKGNGRKIIEYAPVPSELPDFNTFFRIESDFMSVSDVHCPYWHEGLFAHLIRVGKLSKIKNLIINGDFLNFDPFSHYTTGNRGLKVTELEWNSAAGLLARLLAQFEKIYIVAGNHEARLFKHLNGQVPMNRFFKMLHGAIRFDSSRVHVSDYSYMDAVSGDRLWKIIHPITYGDRGGTVPTDLCDKYEANIISGHNHQWGVQMSKNGKYMGIDQGCACDPLKIEYAQMNLTKFRTWQNGFTMVKNGFPTLFNLQFTDWLKWK